MIGFFVTEFSPCGRKFGNRKQTPTHATPGFPPASRVLSANPLGQNSLGLCGLLDLLDKLQLDADRDLVADKPAAGLERNIPVETPLLAVDLGLGAEAGAGGAPGALGLPGVLGI